MSRKQALRSPQREAVTAFQRRVYDALRLVPRGRVTTYKRLAAFIGCNSCRAVGQALRHNPFAPRVPCHRVIASDGGLGGFAGAREGAEIERKRLLLAEEGVAFDGNGRLADKSLIGDPRAVRLRTSRGKGRA